MSDKYDVSRGKAAYNSIVAPIAEYAGILTGVAGIVDDVDPLKIVIGGALYFGAKGIATANQYRIDSQRQENLEKILKE